jgi:REP element-mobilizing transposase RayT
MPARGDVFAPGNYYHIYNRGASRGQIFFTAANYAYCLRLIKKYLPQYMVSIIAYCLMPNHYHFLLRQDGDQPLSKFIGVLFNAYAQALNQQRQRSGSLFEGRFHHVLIDRDEYLIHLCRYIHLNPVRAKLVERPEEWSYSNYLEWIDQRSGTLKDEKFIRQWFPQASAYQTFVNDLQAERDQAKIAQYVWD